MKLTLSDKKLKRNKKIIKALKQGVPHKVIASSLGITRQTVWKISRHDGIRRKPTEKEIL